SCGGDDSSAPSASALAARASIDAASSDGTAAANTAASSDFMNMGHGGPSHFPNQLVTLGLPGPTPALRVSSRGVPPYAPPAPPVATDT
ncbi:carbohydrate-binding protein, partial [Escherichia coli]|nr:carbohydrate-binding protein [Escherichia coli]